MMLTLFTDASLCGQTCAAGYGAWAKRDDMKAGETFGGEIIERVTSSSEAELYAVAHALDLLHKKGLLHLPTKTVMVQSDSVRALQAILQCVPGASETRHRQSRLQGPLLPHRLKLNPIERGAIFIIQDALRHVRPLVRHVKGHQQGDGRNWVNRECDRIARQHMGNARAKRAAADEVRQ
mgnify:CR=1 FL=1